MELNNTRERLNVRNADLTESCFSDAKLAKAQFNDVNLAEAAFTDTNLEGARFVHVNLAGATIRDANLKGMTINGLPVTELIRALSIRAQMVIYAKNLAHMQAFYEGVFLLEVENSEPDLVILGSPSSQLVIVQVPGSVASTIHIADPPIRRSDTPLKLVLEVERIDAARDAARNLRGGVDPVEREWIFQGHRVCDGYDPEGNVVQFRQRVHQW